METNISAFKAQDRKEALQIMMLERTKIMDLLYLKYKVRLDDLVRGLKDY